MNKKKLAEAKEKLAAIDARMEQIQRDKAAAQIVHERDMNDLQAEWVELYDSEERRYLRRLIESQEPKKHSHGAGLCSCGEPVGHHRGYYRG